MPARAEEKVAGRAASSAGAAQPVSLAPRVVKAPPLKQSNVAFKLGAKHGLAKGKDGSTDALKSRATELFGKKS